MRKTALIFLVISIILFTACGNDSISNLIYKNTTENYGDTGGIALPIDINNTSISIMLSSDVSDLGDKIVLKELKERTGIDINIINVPKSEMEQRTKVLLSTNELPDILFGTMELHEINNLGAKGTFVQINKYLNELPNFRRTFLDNEEYSSYFEKYKAYDGNVYIFPGYKPQKKVEKMLLYRKDIFDKNNVRMWNDHESFYQALKKLKSIYPESYPYASKTRDEIFNDWSTSFGIDLPDAFFDTSLNKWVYSCTDIRFKEMLDFMRKLYNEGLIDEDFLTSGESSWESEMMAEHRSFVTFDHISYMDNLYDKVKFKNPDFDLRCANPMSFKKPVKMTETVYNGPCVTNNHNKIISLKLLDYLLSPSGAELMTLGVRNVTYIQEGENDINYLGFSSRDKISINELKEKYGLFTDGLWLSTDKRSAYYSYSEKEKEATDLASLYGGLTVNSYNVKLTNEEYELVNQIKEKITSEVYSFAAEYILSAYTNEDSFTKWVKYANSLGAEKILSIYNGK